MTKLAPTAAEASGWLVESYRVTVFSTAAFPADLVETIWKQVAGGAAEPEEVVARAGGSVRQASGPFGAGRLVTAVQPQRLDLIHAAELDLFSPSMSSVGSLTEAPAVILEKVGPLLETLLPFHRIAVGSVLITPVSTKADGYRALRPFLPNLVIDESSSDLLYQVNRPRPSTALPGYSINRIGKWSVQAMRHGIIEASAQPEEIAPLSSSTITFATRFEADINTAFDKFDPILEVKRRPLLQELAESLVEMAERGDIA